MVLIFVFLIKLFMSLGTGFLMELSLEPVISHDDKTSQRAMFLDFKNFFLSSIV